MYGICRMSDPENRNTRVEPGKIRQGSAQKQYFRGRTGICPAYPVDTGLGTAKSAVFSIAKRTGLLQSVNTSTSDFPFRPTVTNPIGLSIRVGFVISVLGGKPAHSADLCKAAG
jgi:hypothetical protein